MRGLNSIKHASVFVVILATGCLIMQDRLGYWLGYFKIPNLFLVWNIIVWIAAFLLVGAVLIVCISSPESQKAGAWKAFLVVGIILFVVFDLKTPASKSSVIVGLKNRVLSDITLDEMRRFAHDIDSLSIPNSSPVPGEKVFMHGDLTAVEEKLRDGKYSILMKTSMPTSVTESSGVVSVWWGRQEWGFSIVLDQRGSVQEANRDVIILPIAKDIFFRVASAD